jgi:hypothetical protein
LPIKAVTVRSVLLDKSRATACSARMPAPAQLADTVRAQPDGLKARMIGHITVNGGALAYSTFSKLHRFRRRPVFIRVSSSCA